MKKKLLLIMLSAAMAVSCAEVPENITEREAQLSRTEQAEVSDANERGDLDFIRERLAEDVSKKYGTITVKHASAGTAKEMPVYKIKVGGGDYTVKELAKYLYRDRYGLDNKSFYEMIPWDSDGKEPVPYNNEFHQEFDLWAPGVYTDVYSFFPEKEKDMTISCHIFSDGTCWGSQTGINAYGEDYDAMFLGQEAAHYFPEFDSISGVSYKMYDGSEWSLEEAVRFTEDFWNSELSKNDPEKYTYFVRRIDVFSLPSNGNYGYLFTMSFTDEKGNRYECDSYDDYLLEESKVYDGKRFFLSQRQWQFSLRKDEITRFDKYFSFSKTKAEDSADMLTLGSALGIMENKLAGRINLSFDTAELCYILTCDKYPDKDYGGNVKYNPYFARKYCDIYLRPYWCFRKGNGFTDCWHSAENYYVDAVTGELTVVKLNG